MGSCACGSSAKFDLVSEDCFAAVLTNASGRTVGDYRRYTCDRCGQELDYADKCMVVDEYHIVPEEPQP